MPRSTRYVVSDEEFTDAVKSSFSIAEALRTMKLCIYGSSYKTFRIRVKALGLDTSHFTGQGHLKGKTHNWSTKISLNDYLISGSDKVLAQGIKHRIIEDGLLKNQCDNCGLPPKWCGNPITLQIDHINGNPFDHRIENLRLLCPNCHSQTATFGNKNRSGRTTRKSGGRRIAAAKPLCPICGINEMRSGAKSCVDCYRSKRKELQTPYARKTKIDWPPLERLIQDVANSNYTQVAKKLCVSDNAIRKHIKNASRR